MIIASNDSPRVLSPTSLPTSISSLRYGIIRSSPITAALKILLLSIPTFFAKSFNENAKIISEPHSKGFSQVISDVFYSLFAKKEDGITEKLNRLALKINNSPNPPQHVSHHSLEFFEILFEKETGFDLAIQVAQKALFSKVPSEPEVGKLLLKMLIDKNQKIKEIRDLVEQLISAKDADSLLMALDVSSFLVQSDRDYATARLATYYGLSHDDQAVLNSTWHLQELLRQKEESWCFSNFSFLEEQRRIATC